MGKIKILSEELVNKIAAGEVVESPASVVKELLDNAFDAKSSIVTVEIEEGGIKKILIADNGMGMTKEDAELAFKPHATSKISNESDLLNIKMYGFRGEALSSIAAVSKITLKTRVSGADTGTEVKIEGGQLISISDIGCPAGTSILVEDLFYNVPARKEFLKTPQTEYKDILEIVNAHALANPLIGISLTHNAKNIYTFPKEDKLEDRVRGILGADFIEKLAPLFFEHPHLEIFGYVAKPEIASERKKNQYLFVNKRAINNRAINFAIKDAYGTLIPNNTYPPFIIFIDVPANIVDVNVHPRKEEVKFTNEQFIFTSVKSAVKKSLDRVNLTPGSQDKKPGFGDSPFGGGFGAGSGGFGGTGGFGGAGGFGGSRGYGGAGGFGTTGQRKTGTFGGSGGSVNSPFGKPNAFDNTYKFGTSTSSEIKDSSKLDGQSGNQNQPDTSKEDNKTIDLSQNDFSQNDDEKKDNTNLFKSPFDSDNKDDDNKDDITKDEKEKNEQNQGDDSKDKFSDVVKDSSDLTDDNNTTDNTKADSTQQDKKEDENKDNQQDTTNSPSANDTDDTNKTDTKSNDQYQDNKNSTNTNNQFGMNNQLGYGSNSFGNQYNNRPNQNFGNRGFGNSPYNNPDPFWDDPMDYEQDGFGNNFGQNQVSNSKIMIVHNLYIVTESEDGIIIYDQHAVHERIVYEELLNSSKEEKQAGINQPMLTPVIVNLSIHENEIVSEYLDELQKLGFIIEEFGRNTYKINQVPSVMVNRDVKALFHEIIEDLSSDEKPKETDSKSNRMLKFLACRTAYKAGDVIPLEEAQALIEKLSQMDNEYTCPHGRPVKVELNLKELSKMFKRT